MCGMNKTFLQKIKFSAEYFQSGTENITPRVALPPVKDGERGVREIRRDNIVANITFERREIRV